MDTGTTALVAVMILLANTILVVEATQLCSAEYTLQCSLSSDCITECSPSSLAKERDGEFCIPTTDPESLICDNSVEKCCKYKGGVLVGIILGCGVGLIGIAVVLAYLCGKLKTGNPSSDKAQDKESAAADQDANDQEAGQS